MHRLVFAVLGIVLLSLLYTGSAWAQAACPGSATPCQTPAQAGIPTLSGNNSWTGANTSSGLSSTPHSSTECGTTITPAHNNIVCTLTANATLAAPTFTDGAPYKLTLTQNNTGNFTVSLPTSGFAANCSVYCSGANLLISSGANTTSIIDLFSVPLPSGNVLELTGISAGIVPYTGTTSYTLTSAQSGQGSGGTAQSATPAATLTLNTGDTLEAFVFSCVSNCAGNGPVPTGISASGATLGSCVALGPSTNGPNIVASYTQTSLQCPITAGATNSAITANFSGAVAFYSQIIVVDVARSPAATLVDEGVGVNGVNVSAAPSMTPTQSVNLLLASAATLGTNTLTAGSGWTMLQSVGGQGFAAEYQITTTNAPVSAAFGISPTSGYNIVAAALQ